MLKSWIAAARPSPVQLHAAPRDVVFLHIPKTAGTSMRNALVAARPKVVRVFEYGSDTPKMGGTYDQPPQTSAGILEMRRSAARSTAFLVCGHFQATKYLGAFHPASFVTFLRHPVDRLVSAYQYYVKHHDFRGTFTDFIESPDQINIQTKLLAGIDLRDIGFVGLIEAMPDMVVALSRHLGVELKNRRDNVGLERSRPAVDESIRARIQALNEDDVELYRHVEANLDHFTSYRDRRGGGPLVVRGNVTSSGPGTFRGWAVSSLTCRLVELEVRIGPQVIHRCFADQFMPRLKEQHRVPHGVGGFSVQIPMRMLAGQTHIRFVIAGTDRDLPGSPVAL